MPISRDVASQAIYIRNPPWVDWDASGIVWTAAGRLELGTALDSAVWRNSRAAGMMARPDGSLRSTDAGIGGHGVRGSHAGLPLPAYGNAWGGRGSVPCDGGCVVGMKRGQPGSLFWNRTVVLVLRRMSYLTSTSRAVRDSSLE